MTRESTSRSDPSVHDSPVARRSVLAAVGAGTAVALAGCAGRAATDPTPTPEPAGDAIDPQFGWIGRSPDAEPPVEPDHEVQLLIREREGGPVPEFYFEPVGLSVEPGDVVNFVMATPDHTVTAYHPALGRTQRVPDGVPAISSPVLGGGTYWLYRLETPGVYDLNCAPHEPYGMAMRVVVGEASGPGVDPVSMEQPAHGELRPPFQTSATVLADPALDPETILAEGSVAWADLDDESKQLQG